MTLRSTRSKASSALLLALVLLTSMAAAPLSAAAAPSDLGSEEAVASPTIVEPETTASAVTEVDRADRGAQDDDRPTDPSTEETVGYVGGYWYDDELSVDDRDDASLAEDELEAVVYRSMARVEVLRERPFEETVDVEVVSREEYRAETSEGFEEVSDRERIHQNIRFEAAFWADRDTDAVGETEAFYGGGVAGYYDPATDRIVIVSDTPDRPEMDELTLGHELTHAMQDQYVDLTRYNAALLDEANGENGLIEGEANWIEAEYGQRCGVEWNCVAPSDAGAAGGDLNMGLFVAQFFPYSDGPAFVEQLRDEGGWEAVDAAYDDPPKTSSEVIRPERYGEYDDVEIEIGDTSSDDWQRLEYDDGEPEQSRFGEAGLVAMIVKPALDTQWQAGLIGPNEFINYDGASEVDEFDPYNYDHEYTDGWAGDRLEKYVTDAETIEESGYVWRIEWESEDDAEQFLEAYAWLLEYHDADPVDDRQNTFTIDDDYPGAYYVDRDGETMTIVRAPSVDELPEIRDGAAPEGEDTIDHGMAADGDDGDDTNDASDTDGADDGERTTSADNGSDDGEETPGFGVAVAVVALLVAGVTLRRR